ncbi:hypothetical protein N7523_003564 [Penicillium sp. IBT 18751x]|nr:hypothetical protein N7523_003564 [Penicillium sp. IBT 18751x]
MFYIHWWDYMVSIPELVHVLNNLVTSEKVIQPLCTGPWIVLVHGMRDLERETTPMCRDEGMDMRARDSNPD